jgi:hypothetical protein
MAVTTADAMFRLVEKRMRAVEVLDSIPDTPATRPAKERLRLELAAIDRILSPPPSQALIIEDPANERLYLAALRLETQRMRRAKTTLGRALRPKALPKANAER